MVEIGDAGSCTRLPDRSGLYGSEQGSKTDRSFIAGETRIRYSDSTFFVLGRRHSWLAKEYVLIALPSTNLAL